MPSTSIPFSLMWPTWVTPCTRRSRTAPLGRRLAWIRSDSTTRFPPFFGAGVTAEGPGGAALLRMGGVSAPGGTDAIEVFPSNKRLRVESTTVLLTASPKRFFTAWRRASTAPESERPSSSTTTRSTRRSVSGFGVVCCCFEKRCNTFHARWAAASSVSSRTSMIRFSAKATLAYASYRAHWRPLVTKHQRTPSTAAYWTHCAAC